jgi:hypothetical protein
MLSDAEQARTRSLRLRIRADGTLQFAYRTAAGATLAFMRRDTTPLTGRLNPAVSGSLGHSPMEVLARELYLGPDGRIIGEAPAGPQRWPSVVLAR